MKRLILLLFLLAVPSIVSGLGLTEHYVTTTGTDTWANCTSSGTPCSWATMLTNAIAGDRVNVKAGTYSRTTSVDAFTNAGTNTSPIVIRGYSSVITDGYQGRTNDDGALITTNMPAITYTTTGNLAPGKAFLIFESLNIATANSGAGLTLSGDSALTRSKVINSSTNAAAIATLGGNRSVIFNNDIELTGASGGTAAVSVASTTSQKVIGNRIKGGPSVGITSGAAGGATVIAFNTIFVGTGIQVAMTNTGGVPVYLYNTIVGGSADAINIITGTTGLVCAIGNMITDNSGDGIDMVSTANSIFAANNRFRDNANTYNNAGDWVTATSYSDVTSGTGTSDYFGGSGSSGDYRLLFTSPARQAGQPLYMSMGALSVPTPTPTPTATATSTATSTATATFTPTATATASFTPCFPTPTATATFTPTATATSTATATATFTPTPTATPVEMSYGFQG